MSFMRTTLCLRADRRGVAAAEFAMVATVMLLFVLAIVDIGGSIQQRLVLQQAVRAAGQYAQSFPTQTDGIQKAVQAALPSGWLSSVTMSCQDAASSQTSDCSSGCSSSTVSGSGSMVLQVCRPYTPFLFQTGNCTVGNQSGNCVSYAIRYQ
jgi:Flp pilus assembly protein TadG